MNIIVWLGLLLVFLEPCLASTDTGGSGLNIIKGTEQWEEIFQEQRAILQEDLETHPDLVAKYHPETLMINTDFYTYGGPVLCI